MKHVYGSGNDFHGRRQFETQRPSLADDHSIKCWCHFSAAYFAGRSGSPILFIGRPLMLLWERFSIWLITAGLIVAGLAVIAYVIDLAGGRQITAPGLAPRHWLRTRCRARAW